MISNPTTAYFQAQALEWGPKIVFALLILVMTWIVARALKSLLVRSEKRVPALQRHSASDPRQSVGRQLGSVASLIVWLVGIMAALSFLGIGQILQPVAALTAGIFEFLPRLIGAGLIFFVGLIVARIVRDLVETLVSAANLEGLTGKLGIPGAGESATAGASGRAAGSAKASIARAAGITVFALIIIPVAIAALQVLGVDAISRPAIGMLSQILAAIPHILSAALWVGIAFLAGRLLKSVIEAILPATGFDAAARSTGIVPASTAPSRIVGTIVLAAIVLTAAIEAARQLGGSAIAGFLEEITALGGRVLFGSLIIAAGVFIARFISSLVSSTEGAFGQTLMRYGIIALAAAIGLRFMGLANEIVILAFGLILGSAALAAGLAFGIGGRKPAERVLDEYASRVLSGQHEGGPSAFSFDQSHEAAPQEQTDPATRI